MIKEAAPRVVLPWRSRKYAASRQVSAVRKANREVRTRAWAPQSSPASPAAASRAAHQPGSPVSGKWARQNAMTVSQVSSPAQSLRAGQAFRRQPRQ